MESALLLNVIVGEGAAVFQLLAGKDKTLLIWGDALLVLNLRLDVVDSITRFDFEGDGFAGEGLYEDLHLGTRSVLQRV